MKKLLQIISALVMIALAFGCLKPKYDAEAVKENMRSVTVIFGQLNMAVEAGDFEEAKVQLDLVIESFAGLEEVEPRMGSKEEWDAIHNETIALAEKGIEACDAGDIDTLKVVVQKILAAKEVGHGKFIQK